MARRARRPGPAPTARGPRTPAGAAPAAAPGVQLLRAAAQLAGLGAGVALALVVVSATFAAAGHGGRVAAGVEVGGATGPSATASYLHDLDRVATRRTGLAVRSLGPEWHKLFAEESAQVSSASPSVSPHAVPSRARAANGASAVLGD